MKLQVILTFLLAMILSACGGGGGGSSPSPSPSPEPGFSSAASSSSSTNSNKFDVVFSQTELKENLPSLYDSFLISATAVGDPGVATVYVDTRFSGEGIDRINMSLGATDGYLHVYPRLNLWNGNYTGNITVRLCNDAGCSKQLGHSPYLIPYTFVSKSADWRLEPVNAPAVKRFEKANNAEHLSIYAQESVANSPIHMRIDLPSGGQAFSFDDATIKTLSITNITADGFDFTPPNEVVGNYDKTYSIKVLMSNGDTRSIDLLISQIVAPKGVDANHFSFLVPSVPLKVLYGINLPDGTAIPFYLPYADCVANGFKQPSLSVEYLTGKDWLITSNFSANIGTDAETLPLGHYEAKVTGESCVHEKSSVQVLLDVVSGYFVNGPIYADFNCCTADFNYPSTVLVGASKDLTTYAWDATAQDDGFYFVGSSSTTSASGGSDPLAYQFQYQWDKNFIAGLPNNHTYERHILIRDPNNKIPSQTMTIYARKFMPEIISAIPNVIESGKAFDLSIEGTQFAVPPYLLELFLAPVNNPDGINGLITVKYTAVSQTDTSAVLHVAPLNLTGDYELIVASQPEFLTNYQIPFVKRQKLKFVTSASANNGAAFKLKALP